MQEKLAFTAFRTTDGLAILSLLVIVGEPSVASSGYFSKWEVQWERLVHLKNHAWIPETKLEAKWLKLCGGGKLKEMKIPMGLLIRNSCGNASKSWRFLLQRNKLMISSRHVIIMRTWAWISMISLYFSVLSIFSRMIPLTFKLFGGHSNLNTGWCICALGQEQRWLCQKE
ncbi:hypothetical protein SADUNF_Sadunf11G0122800 [Salix dunnii]|uniref:Uncharacterized protein n=1 Tax=Salix dunnii TaxID=1413687 RepID=A0A835MPP7_9ROSI|nr:hypothetical protein SADUNF_Sadunf11G0122800 [Salix dunnii]